MPQTVQSTYKTHIATDVCARLNTKMGADCGNAHRMINKQRKKGIVIGKHKISNRRPKTVCLLQWPALHVCF